MPLLKGNTIPPLPIPSPEEISRLETPEVYYIPFTAEIFISYDDYYARIMLYRSKVWTCAETSKEGLTFQQALESEKKALKKADIQYPAVWIKPTLELIHHSRLPLNELVDLIYDYFRGTRFVNEYVYVDVPTNGTDRAVERALIVDKVPNTVPITLERRIGDKRQMQRDMREAREDNSRVPDDPHHYRIQLVNNPTREYIVAPNQMRRGRQTLSKQTFKKYVKDVAKKEKLVGSPWVVRGPLCSRYGLSTENPPQAEDLYKNANSESSHVRKRRRMVDLNENPIEDTELFADDYKLKEDTANPRVLPPLSFDYSPVSSQYGFHLVQIYTFVHVYGTPLGIHPFFFCDFLESLKCDSMDKNCELLPELFGNILKFACIEYQARFEPGSGTNVHFNPLPVADENGNWNTSSENAVVLQKLEECYDKFNVYEKIALDQWYKWRPNQYSGSKKKNKVVTYSDRLKAWPVALFGFIRDWFNPSSNSDDLRIGLLAKLLFNKKNQSGNNDEAKTMEVDSIEPSEESGSRNQTVENSEVDELESEETPLPKKRNQRTKNGTPAKPKKTPKKESSANTCQFEELCNDIEHAFWTLTADERVLILSFLVSECVLDSDILRTFRDEALERTTELKKEQREVARKRKALAVSIAELEKTITGNKDAALVTTVEPVAAPPSVDKADIDKVDSEHSDLEMDSESRPIRRTRQSASRKLLESTISIPKDNSDLDLLDLPPEQIAKRKELRKLEEEDRIHNRRENILEFEIRASQSISRFKPIGRDRFCNKYWWFDGGLSSISLEAITKIFDVPDAVDPYIAQEFAFGYLFVEQVVDPTQPLPTELFDPSSDMRQGILDGKWGYYSDPEQVTQLLKWIDPRGLRESTLLHNLEYFSEFIIDGMQRRQKLITEEQETLKEAQERGGTLEDGTLYKEPFLLYKNHWAV